MKNREHLPAIAERIKRCRHCGREMSGTHLAYAENPFCEKCLDDRIKAAAIPNAANRWIRRGAFVRLT